MSTFNRMTLVAAAEIIADAKSHSEIDVLAVQWGISDRCVGGSKAARVASLSETAIANNVEVFTENGRLPVGRAVVEEAIKAAPRARDTQSWRKLRAGLRFDGFEVIEESTETEPDRPWGRSTTEIAMRLVPMLPSDIPGLNFREAENEVVELLQRYDLATSLGHLRRALSAFERGEWSSANGELRNFYESYLNEIAIQLGCPADDDSKSKRDYLGGLTPPFLLPEYNEWHENNQKPQYVQGLMSRMHPHGGHPGLSEEEDATFRLQIMLVTARLFLRRLDQRERF